MKVRIEKITPQWALDVLENHNPHNRKLAENTVQAYANDMRNGRWVLNHQGIAFDTEGNLQDGQHRLWAVVFSEKEIEMQVTYDMPILITTTAGKEVTTMDTIDRGRMRQTGQQMQLHGIANGALTAAACRSIAMMLYQSRGNTRISTTNSMLIYDIWGKDIEVVIGCLDGAKKKGYIVGPLALFHHGEPDKTRDFCAQITTLENMSPNARAFCKYMEVTHAQGRADKTSRILAQCLKNFYDGKNVTKAQDSEGGREFLSNMYPSLTKRLRDALKPIDTTSIRKKLNAIKRKQNA